MNYSTRINRTGLPAIKYLISFRESVAKQVLEDIESVVSSMDSESDFYVDSGNINADRLSTDMDISSKDLHQISYLLAMQCDKSQTVTHIISDNYPNWDVIFTIERAAMGTIVYTLGMIRQLTPDQILDRK